MTTEVCDICDIANCAHIREPKLFKWLAELQDENARLRLALEAEREAIAAEGPRRPTGRTPMTNAPERIKAWVTRNGVTEWEAGSLQFPPDTEVEYIRADLACPKVKQLEWVDYPINGDPVVSMAETILGTYFICDDTDDFTGLYLEFVSHGHATWYGTVKPHITLISDHYHIDDHSPLQKVAQADYEHRILSALEADHE